jgi:two-component system NtrC family sensor kinase
MDKKKSLKKKNTHPSDSRQNKDFLNKYESLKERVLKLERLVEIISRGKYQWEATFDAITAPVQIVTADYRIERANIGLAVVGGRNITEIVGHHCYEIFAGRTSVCEGCPLKDAVSQDKPKSHELCMLVRERQFVANAYPYALEGKGPDAAVMYYRDITEECRFQQEAMQQEKMAAIGLLAGGIAHEINNPLGGILAFTQLLMRDVKDNDPLICDLKEIEGAAVRCKKIVSDLLDFSRVSKERENCLVDVNVLLDKVFPFLRGDLQSLNVELDFRPAKELPNVKANPDRLQQVFLNILTNASHAMPKGGKLFVKTMVDACGRVVIRISDTGVGIAEEDLPRIFEPFFTTKSPSKGTGLGLSIAYRIIKEHGGNIEVESEVGKGSTFTILLPSV